MRVVTFEKNAVQKGGKRINAMHRGENLLGEGHGDEGGRNGSVTVVSSRKRPASYPGGRANIAPGRCS